MMKPIEKLYTHWLVDNLDEVIDTVLSWDRDERYYPVRLSDEEMIAEYYPTFYDNIMEDRYTDDYLSEYLDFLTDGELFEFHRLKALYLCDKITKI